MPAAAYESFVGTLFAGRFRIEKLLGKGGMGAVFLAEHEVLGRKLAIKIIHKKLLLDLSVAARFRREARAASRVNHPNITAVHDFGYSEEGLPYLAMEYVNGPSLAVEISRTKRFPVRRALHILRQLADGFEAAHENLVIHRDLKPHNVMLCTRQDDADFVKVVDFGLAKIIGVATAGMLSKEGHFFGTPYYMSPEQCTGEKVDLRGDIYSFGVLAYELLVGKVPYSGTVVDVMRAHTRTEPPVPSQAANRKDIPAQLDRMIHRCMAKRPEDRYQSASDLSVEIRSLQQRVGDVSPIRVMLTAPGVTSLIAARTEEYRALVPTFQATHGGSAKADDDADLWRDDTDADSKCQDEHRRLRTRALEELAYLVRDLGLGSAEISHILAQKVEAEERSFELAASIALLEADGAEIEAAARERGARLQQVLNQLEHERALLAPRNPAETLAVTEFALQDSRLRRRIAELTRRMQAIAAQSEKDLLELQSKLAEHRCALLEVQQEVEASEVQLAELLAEVRPQIEGSSDPELLRLLELASC